MAKSCDLTSYSLVDPYEGQAASIRDVTKWLIAAFAAVGAIVIADLKFSDIGKLNTFGRLAAIAWATGALVSVGLAIFVSTRVLKPPRPSLESLMLDPHLSSKVEIDNLLLISEYKTNDGHTSLTTLSSCHEEAIQKLRSVQENYNNEGEPGPVLQAQLEEARSEADHSRRAIQEALSYANYLETNERFDQTRWITAISGAAIFICTLGFLFTATIPGKGDEKVLGRVEIQLPAGTYQLPTNEQTMPQEERITKPTRVAVTFLTEDARKKMEDVYKCALPPEPFDAWAIGGDFKHPELLLAGRTDKNNPGMKCGPCRYTVTDENVFVYLPDKK